MEKPSSPTPLKALIAPGRYTDGPTFFTIYRSADGVGYDIHEQMPDGESVIWPGPAPKGVQQAEAIIYGWARDRQETR